MKTQTVTAVIPAKNEEKNIERCLNSLKWCNSVYVIFSGTDDTGKIAESMGSKVIHVSSNENDDFIALQKNINKAIDEVDTDWIIRIDADEEVTPELEEEILSVSSKDSDIVAYGLPRRQYFWGGFLKGGDWAYDRLIRLFKKGYARYEPIVQVHEQFKVNGKIGYLKNSLNHYSHPTLKDASRKFQAYTDVQIHDLKESQISAVFHLITQPPYIFFRWLIWHKGYKDGLRGILAAAYRAWYEFLLYKKYIAKRFS